MVDERRRFADAEPLKLQYGERVRINLINDTMMNHPIHLHGVMERPGDRGRQQDPTQAHGDRAAGRHDQLPGHRRCNGRLGPITATCSITCPECSGRSWSVEEPADDEKIYGLVVVLMLPGFVQAAGRRSRPHQGDDRSDGGARNRRPGSLGADAQAWIGQDLNKFWLKLEGEYLDGKTTEAEVQALYSRAVAPYWDLQLGWRHDIRPDRAAIGWRSASRAGTILV